MEEPRRYELIEEPATELWFINGFETTKMSPRRGWDCQRRAIVVCHPYEVSGLRVRAAQANLQAKLLALHWTLLKLFRTI